MKQKHAQRNKNTGHILYALREGEHPDRNTLTVGSECGAVIWGA